MTDTTQTSLIYDRLRDGILSLDMTPGRRLTERSLEAELHASRTPVRAALMRLQTEGLVQRDGRGWQVSPIDVAEIRGLMEFREVIEAAAVRLACERASDDEIDALHEMLRAFDAGGSRAEGHRMGTDFHVQLVALCQNDFLAASEASTMTRLSRTRWLEVQTEDSRELARAEHRRLLDAVRRREGDEAAALAVSHIRGTRDRLMAVLQADERSLRARGYAVR